MAAAIVRARVGRRDDTCRAGKALLDTLSFIPRVF
jgi:hypothetical protein